MIRKVIFCFFFLAFSGASIACAENEFDDGDGLVGYDGFSFKEKISYKRFKADCLAKIESLERLEDLVSWLRRKVARGDKVAEEYYHTVLLLRAYQNIDFYYLKDFFKSTYVINFVSPEGEEISGVDFSFFCDDPVSVALSVCKFSESYFGEEVFLGKKMNLDLKLVDGLENLQESQVDDVFFTVGKAVFRYLATNLKTSNLMLPEEDGWIQDGFVNYLKATALVHLIFLGFDGVPAGYSYNGSLILKTLKMLLENDHYLKFSFKEKWPIVVVEKELSFFGGLAAKTGDFFARADEVVRDYSPSYDLFRSQRGVSQVAEVGFLALAALAALVAYHVVPTAIGNVGGGAGAGAVGNVGGRPALGNDFPRQDRRGAKPRKQIETPVVADVIIPVMAEAHLERQREEEIRAGLQRAAEGMLRENFLLLKRLIKKNKSRDLSDEEKERLRAAHLALNLYDSHHDDLGRILSLRPQSLEHYLEDAENIFGNDRDRATKARHRPT